MPLGMNCQCLLLCYCGIVNTSRLRDYFDPNAVLHATISRNAIILLIAGEELLPEEDPTQFKPIPELSLLDSFLIANQISTYCDQLTAASTNTMEKLYVVDALQKGSIH
jgi:hypothetical protein